MEIRKKFLFDGTHIVRNCSASRSKTNFCGHSYTVEVFLGSDGLNNGGMVVDFSLINDHIRLLIDSFDNTFTFWTKESEEFKKIIKENNLRWIESPLNTSVEGFALMFVFLIDKLIKNTNFNNGEKKVKLTKVRVHKNNKFYAEAKNSDISKFMNKIDMENDFVFSKQVEREWKPDHKFLIKAAVDIPFNHEKAEVTHK